MKGTTLQDRIFSYLVEKRINTTFYLMNGFQIRGQVTGFDQYTVVIWAVETKTQDVIFKHAISTIIPEKPVPLPKE